MTNRLRLSPSGAPASVGDEPWAPASGERLIHFGGGTLPNNDSHVIDLAVADPIAPGTQAQQRYSVECYLLVEPSQTVLVGGSDLSMELFVRSDGGNVGVGVVRVDTHILDIAASTSGMSWTLPLMGYLDVASHIPIDAVRVVLASNADLSSFAVTANGSTFRLRRRL